MNWHPHETRHLTALRHPAEATRQEIESALWWAEFELGQLRRLRRIMPDCPDRAKVVRMGMELKQLVEDAS